MCPTMLIKGENRFADKLISVLLSQTSHKVGRRPVVENKTAAEKDKSPSQGYALGQSYVNQRTGLIIIQIIWQDNTASMYAFHLFSSLCTVLKKMELHVVLS